MQMAGLMLLSLIRHRVMLPVLLLLSACSEMPEHLAPTGHAITAPSNLNTSFQQYLDDTRTQLELALTQVYQRTGGSPFGDHYPLDVVVQMRAPFEIPVSAECAADAPRTGYLLVHGLTDSPYLLSAMARAFAEQSPCVLVRSLLLPGHGTSPGDALEVHRDEWRQVVRFGVNSFKGEVDELYLVGYSAGAAILAEYADQNRNNAQLAGLLLMSPALGLPDPLTWLSPYARWFISWMGAEQERDAAKYETLPINAGAELYKLIQEMNWPKMQTLDIPVMMVVSGADNTVDVNAAEQFFCEKAPVDRRRLIWFQAADGSHRSQLNCSGTVEQSAVDSELRTVSVSHVGLTLPASDPHYGRDAAYRQCLHYRQSPERLQQCLTDDAQTVYGERSLLVEGLFEGRVLRRATFNPHFASMMEEIGCFLADQCEPNRQKN
ncbi:MAG TPA: alpha/beta fold hydrolase [Pseudohongiella sp.]|nr:alpha/beta fold hydrolase [Pseudohongiella sp.]